MAELSIQTSPTEVHDASFSHTRSALFHLQKSLQCRKCHQFCKELFTLGQCEHRFCWTCVEDRQGTVCPLCNIPSYATEAHVDKQLSNIASLCWLMSDLLNGNQLPSTLDQENGNQATVKQTMTVTVPRRKESKKAKSNQRRVQKCSDHSSKSPSSLVAKAGNDEDNKTSNNFQSDKSGEFNKNGAERHVKKTVASDSNNFSAMDECRQKDSDVHNGDGLKSVGTLNLRRQKVVDESRQKDSEVHNIDGVTSAATPNLRRQKVVDESRQKDSEVHNIDGVKSVATPNLRRQKKKLGHQDLQSKELSVDSCHKTPSKSRSENVKEQARNKHIERSASKPKTYLSKRNAKGETPLQVATIKADVETVNSLLEEGANPNVRDNAGWTPLHEAVNHGNATIAELLLNYGASVNAPGLGNDTPLHDAVINCHLECVKLLVSRGANALARNIHGHTPLDQAQTDGMREILLTASGTLPALDMTTSVVTEVSGQSLCLLGTALSKSELTQLLKCAKVLKAKVVDDFSSEVSHLITGVNAEGMCPRTLKYLSVVLAGQWVVSTKWLTTCLERNSRVPEEEFEIVGCTNSPHTLAPKKARENKCAQLPGLFDGCQFYFHGKFNYPTPSREELAGLVKSGGGAILTREPRLYSLDDYPYTIPFHALPSSGLADCAIFIIYDDTCPEPPYVEAQRMTCLPISWLLDSIASFSLLDKAVYLKH